MKLVHICSPYPGEVERNKSFAKEACRYAIVQGCAPIAVHLLYPQFLNDAVPAKREAGIQMGFRYWFHAKNYGFWHPDQFWYGSGDF